MDNHYTTESSPDGEELIKRRNASKPEPEEVKEHEERRDKDHERKKEALRSKKKDEPQS